MSDDCIDGLLRPFPSNEKSHFCQEHCHIVKVQWKIIYDSHVKCQAGRDVYR